MAITWPVMYSPFVTRNATSWAISSGRPNRPIGIFSRIFARTSSGMAAIIWVAMKPGAIALTVTPLLASSSAAVFVKPTMPAFAAA